uniref:TrmH family RNA methyltransferase n=1 Tax=Acetatifactor sp. TaxID=1872090 RepID=UPI00405793D8
MITSAANARIKQLVQWQTKAKERRKDKVYLVEGFKMFEEAPEDSILEVYLSEDAVQKVFQWECQEEKSATPNTFGSRMIGEKLQRTGYEEVSADIFRKISDTQTPQGILTVLRRPEYDLNELLKCPNPLFVVLENLQDPGNLGTIIRTGEGAGITGVIMSEQTVDIYNPKVIRATMGSIYRVPFVYVKELGDAICKMHEKGIHTYAAHLQGDTYYNAFSFEKPTAFLIGNEGNGLRKDTADLAESYLKIPMEGQVESLNAAIATSLLMYEAHRQRSVL